MLDLPEDNPLKYQIGGDHFLEEVKTFVPVIFDDIKGE